MEDILAIWTYAIYDSYKKHQTVYYCYYSVVTIIISLKFERDGVDYDYIRVRTNLEWVGIDTQAHKNSLV